MLWLKYFCLECKRTGKIVSKSALCILALLLLMIGGVAVVSYGMLQQQMLNKINVGVVVSDQEEISDIAVQFISSMDSVKSICNIIREDEKSVLNRLEKGDLQAVIILPANFYEDIEYGTNTPAKIYVLNQNELESKLFQEVLIDGVSLLQTAESGIYATCENTIGYGLKMKRGRVGYYLTKLYVKEMFNRTLFFTENVISPTGELNTYQYYFQSVLLIVLLMFGINFSILFKTENQGFELKLKSEGLNHISLMTNKLLVMSVVLWIMGSIYFCAGALISEYFSLGIVCFSFRGVIWLFLLCIAISGYFYVVYMGAGKGVGGALLLLLLNVVMILCGGMVIPVAYMPSIIQVIKNFLPVSIWGAYTSAWMFSGVSLENVIAMWGCILIELLIGVAVSWKKS